MKNLVSLTALLNLCQIVLAQPKQEILLQDFEKKPSTQSWFRDNSNVKFSYNENKKDQFNKKSIACLYVRWDSVSKHKPFTWFTDLKADTFAVDGMEARWKAFGPKTWLSFWCKGGAGDTLQLHYLVLSKGHSSKWGSTNMVPVVSNKWKFYKVRFADLTYEQWGKIKADFDLNSAGRCFEIGLRSSAVNTKGFIEAWFDNIKLSNYEPFE